MLLQTRSICSLLTGLYTCSTLLAQTTHDLTPLACNNYSQQQQHRSGESVHVLCELYSKPSFSQCGQQQL